jgi:vancomycin resistance protein YoaR
MSRRRAAAATLFAVVLAGTGAWLARAEGGRLPPGVSVAGVGLGGLSESDARALLERRVRDLRWKPIRLVASGVPDFSLDVPVGSIAGRPLIDRAVRDAHAARGAGSRLLARLGLSHDREVPLRFVLERRGLADLAARLGRELDRQAVPARVRATATAIEVTPSRPGRAVDRPRLRAALEALPSRLEVPLRRVEPAVDDGEARDARDRAERIVASSHEVRLGTRVATLTPGVLRRALRFPTRDGAVAVTLDADALRASLARPLGARQTPPRDARFEVRGDDVAIVPSVAGRLLDTEELGAAIVRDPEERRHEASVGVAEPDLTTAEARAMGIRELVSEFTTPYACCPPRVTNIRRAAEMLDGTIVPIGGRFSLNDALGQRTVDRGFVEAPQIEDGRLVDAVGGGVSQVATTMYNAAFFAGLELVAHTPHQFYISRYPMGREATVSWGGPELIFRNDWAAAILVKAAAADDGITIRLFSSRLGRRVETRTGSPRGRRPPKVVEVQKESLPPGTRTVVQPMGAAGFTVDYTRKVYEGVRLRRDEHFTWTYSAEDAIVEVGPPKEKPEQPERTDGPPGGTPPGAPPPPASPRPPAPPSPTSPSLAPPSPSPLPGRPGSSPSAPPLPGSGG